MSVFIALFFFPTLLPASPSDLHTLWQRAQNQHESKNYASSGALFKEWIEAGLLQDVESPEAYFNFAVSHWALKDYANTQYGLLKSSSLRFSPGRIWKDIRTVAAIEKDLGIKEGLSTKWYFYLYFLINDNVRTLLLTLGLWMFVAVGLGFWLHKMWGIALIGGKVLVPVGLLCCVVALGSFVNAHYFSRFGVLQAKENVVPLFQSASADSDKKLMDLPSGTIVNWVGQKGEFIQLGFPVAAWISKDSLLAINENVGGALMTDEATLPDSKLMP